mgnify:CR=1 FL=1
MTNDPANTIDWPVGSIVIHDADAKTTKMLMLVIAKATKGRYAFFKTISKKVIALDIMPEEKETVFQDAIDTFGEEYQIRKAIEELSELTTILAQYNDEHRENSPGIEDAIVSEIADVMVITEELKIVFKDQDIEGEYNRKIARLRERIKKRFDND